MLAIWCLVTLPFLEPAWTSGSSWFTYCWSLAWRILSSVQMFRSIVLVENGSSVEYKVYKVRGRQEKKGSIKGENLRLYYFSQLSSVALSCPTLWDPMDCSTPGLPVHHQLPETTQTHVHRVGDAIQLFHPLSSPSPPAFNLSQHQGVFQWVGSLHQVTKVLEFQLQHQSFHWIFRTDFLYFIFYFFSVTPPFYLEDSRRTQDSKRREWRSAWGGRKRKRERERESARMHAGERVHEKALWLLLLYVFSSTWACPMQIGLSQECCLFCLKFSLWSSDLPLTFLVF